MLPLVTNILPQNTAPQPSTLAAQSALLSQQASTTARQITAVAITATGAASAYSTQMPERREPVASRAPIAASTGDSRPAILPDPELWRVPTREVNAQPPAPLPERAPITVNLPQVSQFNAQAIAQQAMPAVQQEQRAATPEPVPARKTTSSAYAVPQRSTLGGSSGVQAYAVAAQRNFDLSFASTVEAIS
jgi:hypothetical protein